MFKKSQNYACANQSDHMHECAFAQILFERQHPKNWQLSRLVSNPQEQQTQACLYFKPLGDVGCVILYDID